MFRKKSTEKAQPDGLVFPDLDPPKFAKAQLPAEKQVLSALQAKSLSELLHEEPRPHGLRLPFLRTK